MDSSSSIQVISQAKCAMEMKGLVNQGFFNVENLTDLLDTEALFIVQGRDTGL